VRPTLLTLVGLQDDYRHHGRTIIEPLPTLALPPSLRQSRDALSELGAVYKQVNAAFGRFAMDTLRASTIALNSGAGADDQDYQRLESRISALTDERDALAAQEMLDAAAFGGRAIDEDRVEFVLERASDLLERVGRLARPE